MPGSCAVEECQHDGLLRRGWCEKHYARWRKYGDPNYLLPRATVCSVEECEVTTDLRRGLCMNHYQQRRRTARTPVLGPRKPARRRGSWVSADEALSAHTPNGATNSRGCLEWTGKRFPTGYGHFYVWNQGRRYAHRAAWERAHGVSVPPGMHICHTCDNPPCCNPEHLFLGTPLDNMRDRDAKGRNAGGPNAPGIYVGTKTRRNHAVIRREAL